MTKNKRFTMCHEQNDINGWTMSIVDWQTKQPFDYTTYEVHSSSITDTKDEMEDLCLLLNELHEENQRGGDPRMEYDEIEKVMKSFMEGYDETESLIDNAFARGYDKGFRQGIDITLRMIKNLYKREGKLNDV